MNLPAKPSSPIKHLSNDNILSDLFTRRPYFKFKLNNIISPKSISNKNLPWLFESNLWLLVAHCKYPVCSNDAICSGNLWDYGRVYSFFLCSESMVAFSVSNSLWLAELFRSGRSHSHPHNLNAARLFSNFYSLERFPIVDPNRQI